MADSPSDDADAPAGARMVLEPDAIHEEEEGVSVDCPQCGATVTIEQIVEEGRCDGWLEGDDAEAVDEAERPREGGCGASLSLELVWEA